MATRADYHDDGDYIGEAGSGQPMFVAAMMGAEIPDALRKLTTTPAGAAAQRA